MPRFYLDTHDGDRDTKDDDGAEMPDLASARRAALTLLPDIAREVVPLDGDRRDVIVDVRDSTGMLVYTATLSLVGRWVG